MYCSIPHFPHCCTRFFSLDTNTSEDHYMQTLTVCSIFRQNMPEILRTLKLYFFQCISRGKNLHIHLPTLRFYSQIGFMFLASEVEAIQEMSEHAASSNLYSVQALLLISLQWPALSPITLKLSNKQVPYAVTVLVAQNYWKHEAAYISSFTALMHQDQCEDDFKNIRETLWGMEVLHEVDADCWHVKVNNIWRNRLELEVQRNAWRWAFIYDKTGWGVLCWRKTSVRKLNISTHQKKWREATERT